MILPREAEFVEDNEGDDEHRGLDLGRYEMWQRYGGRGACRPAKIMHSDDIPEEFYLVMAQDMLLRHRGDATDEGCVFCRVQVLSRRAPRKKYFGRRGRSWYEKWGSTRNGRWGSSSTERRGSSTKHQKQRMLEVGFN